MKNREQLDRLEIGRRVELDRETFSHLHRFHLLQRRIELFNSIHSTFEILVVHPRGGKSVGRAPPAWTSHYGIVKTQFPDECNFVHSELSLWTNSCESRTMFHDEGPAIPTRGTLIKSAGCLAGWSWWPSGGAAYTRLEGVGSARHPFGSAVSFYRKLKSQLTRADTKIISRA